MKDTYKNIIKQVSIWDWYARIFPLVFLAISAIIIYTDFEKLSFIFIAGITVFITTAVLWWWWTIYTIAKLAFVLKSAEQNLDEVLTQIKTVKKEFNDTSNRQRREQAGAGSQSDSTH